MKTFGDLEPGDDIFVVDKTDIHSLEVYTIEEINETETEIIFKLIDNKGFIPVSLEYIDKPYEPSKTNATFIDIVFSDIRLYEFIRDESIQRT